jgi:hypothetical protein
MKAFNVIIQATLSKMITVHADSEDKAVEEAFEAFDLLACDDIPERYEQELVSVELVQGAEA